MKRLFAALLAVALGLGVCETAWAQSFQGMHMVTERVMFRSQRNDATLGLSAQQIAQGYSDSVNFTRQGKGVIVDTGTGIADTTAPISLQGFIQMPGSSAVVPDSAVVFRFSLIPGSDCAAASVIDSLYLVPQVSIDGSAWECANLVKDGVSGCNLYTTSILLQSIPILRISKAGTATVLFHSTLAGRTSADINGLGTWPYVRFIVLNDISASATAAKHQFSASITYWTNKSSGTQ